jgi:putative tryptophan/tyrosine transport system substrate-binding protein
MTEIVPIVSSPVLRNGESSMAEMLILSTDSFTGLHEMLIADLAVHYRLPSISYANDFVHEGGLLTYGTNNDLVGQFRRAAGYVDRILKGEKPSELPVQGANRYRFLINLKTAKALGLTIPPNLLALADEVIE